MINQSGLSTTYTSGVDDFDIYIATVAIHTNNVGESWLSESGTTTGTIDFDLGFAFNLNKLALWNVSSLSNPPTDLNTFEIITSLEATFSAANSLGIYEEQKPSPAVPQVFLLPETTARFIRLDAIDNHGSVLHTQIGEVAFSTSVTPIPEPSSYLLFTIGILSLIRIGWRRYNKPV